MPRIVVNEAVASRPDDLAIRINERPATFFLSAFPYPASVLYGMSPRTFDLLLIAESVFTADSLESRGGDARSHFGEAWSRDLHFFVPVSDPEFWRSIETELVETLSFLSGDRFRFEFVPRERRTSRNPGLNLGHGVKADRVVLFSGGLDSLAGTIEELKASKESRLLLITHCSASKIMRTQRTLVRELLGRFPGRITWVPARGHLVGVQARETTQRTRSFLYAALAYGAASLVDLDVIRFYENGVVSLNLPFSRQVIGSMATRTTHPLFLRRMAELLSRVADRTFAVENPYAWCTKTEVLERLHGLGAADLIGRTTSCSSVRRRTAQEPLCGCCSQCLDRRFAALAAGLQSDDPADRYEVELFFGNRPKENDRTMAHDWVRSALNMDKTDLGRFAAHFAAELADVAAGYPDRPAGQVVSDAYLMHRRHGASVSRVAEAAVRDLAPRILQGIPSGSLLASLSQASDEPAVSAELVEEEALPARAGQDLFPLRLVYDPDGGPELLIRGLGMFRGAHLGLVGRLRPFLEADVSAGLPADDHRWVPTGTVGPKDRVRQHARRCRNEFAEQYEIVEGRKSDSHILIQSQPPHGYRLDPDSRFESD